jgi:CRP-like cAMP-binding protein
MLTPFQARAQRVLEASPFFGALSELDMRWIHRSSVRKGELLFGKGDSTDRLYALVGGQMKLSSLRPDGGEISFGLVAPGELIGEIGILNGAPRRASAVALAHSELATIDRADLEPVLDRSPALRAELATAAANAASRLSERIEDAAFLSIEARVEKALADFAQRFGERIDGGTRIRLRQQDLADALGLSRESVSKVLTSPSMRSKLALGRGRIDLIGA